MSSAAAAGQGIAPQQGKESSPRRVARDLHFVRWYAHTVKHVMRRYTDDATTRDSGSAPEEVLRRVEHEVAAECHRMRSMFLAIIGVIVMPFLLAGFMWSGLYWLPVRILWFPFERDAYGLPLFSLYEWFAFLLLIAFAAYSVSMIIDGLASTRRVSTDYRMLAGATPAEQAAIARVATTGAFPRAEFLLRRAEPFAAYRPLLAADEPDSGPSGEGPA